MAAPDPFSSYPVIPGQRALKGVAVTLSDANQPSRLQQVFICATGTLRVVMGDDALDIPIPGPLLLPGPFDQLMVTGTSLTPTAPATTANMILGWV